MHAVVTNATIRAHILAVSAECVHWAMLHAVASHVASSHVGYTSDAVTILIWDQCVTYQVTTAVARILRSVDLETVHWRDAVTAYATIASIILAVTTFCVTNTTWDAASYHVEAPSVPMANNAVQTSHAEVYVTIPPKNSVVTAQCCVMHPLRIAAAVTSVTIRPLRCAVMAVSVM